ncbi:MAG TPA: hypothetical protein VG366_02635 [Solirubrobacteraceae bacterium]|jgi:hypothetical protein|nr:hypothetical protein [Solirubrobacteraceae bacterium]
MLSRLLTTRVISRVSRGVPVARLLLIGEVALMARRHIARLDRSERHRLIGLLLRARGRLGRLSYSERAQLAALIARIEPRLFVGSAIARLSPVPLPKRLLYGPRGGAARRVAIGAARRP